MEDALYRCRNKFDKMSDRKRYYVAYTVCFIVVSLGVFIWFMFGKRTFIWQVDGWNEYYKALVYYAQYLRSIIRGLVRGHKLIIPNWDFSLGEGGDVLQILQCFGIGDPIVALAIFIPSEYLYIFYNVSTLFRLYLAGIAFSALCFKVTGGSQNKWAVLAGAMAYVFSHWGIYHSSAHPYFITPMICLPLLILGAEKIIRKESTLLFSIAVFWSAMCNFYFFYILVLLMVIYVIARLCYLYAKEVKTAVLVLVKIGSSALLGVGLSAIVFLPVCSALFSNDRIGSAYSFRNLFYPLSYYSELLGIYLSKTTAFDLHMGFAVPVFLATCLLFTRKREHRFLKILFVISVIFILFPVFGQILNGFSYMSNRWCFAFVLLSAYTLTIMWPFLVSINEQQGKLLFVCITVYYILCMLLEYSRRRYVFTAVALCYILLFLLLFRVRVCGKEILNNKNVIVFGILTVSIFQIGFWRNSSAADASNTAAEGIEARNAGYDILKMNESEAIKEYAEWNGEERFFRYSGRNLTKNAAQLSGLSSTQFYYSFANPYVTKYRNELELTDTGQTFCYEGYDDRAILLSLASVLYYATHFQDNAQLPYGLKDVWTVDVRDALVQNARNSLKEELETDELSERQEYEIRSALSSWWSVYENEYFLPLAYTYDSYVPENIWKDLSAIEKQEAMLQSVHLEEKPELIDEGTLELTSKKIPFEITCNSDEISIRDHSFIVTAPNASVTLTLEGLPECETYFSTKGLEYVGVSDYELYLGDETVDPYNIYTKTMWSLLSYDRRKSIRREHLFWTEPEGAAIKLVASNGTSNNINYKTPSYTWYSDRHNFTAGMGYSKDAVTEITLSFQNKGVYQYDDMEITCQPLKEYGKRIQDLKQYTEGNIEVATDKVAGTIRLDFPRILCFSIPYSDGWRAYVDGQETKIYHANTAYMAIEIGAGEHVYELVYDTPLLKIGAWISVISAVLICTIYFCGKRSGKNND